MSFSIDENKNITLTRGDSALFSVTVWMDGEVYEMQDGDRIDFGVKADYDDAECVMHKTSTTNPATFQINPEDTSDWEFGTYRYDAQFVAANGFTDTFIVKKRFKLDKEVTVPNGRDDG
jgi:hypothetical protein